MQELANWTMAGSSVRGMELRRVRTANEPAACSMYVGRLVARKIDDQATALRRAKVRNLDFTTTEQPQSHSNFFKLPGELRNQIYELVISTHIQHSDEEVDLLRATPPSQDFLLSCQRTYTEARHMYPDSARHYWRSAHFTLTIDREITYERMSSKLRLPHIRRQLDLMTYLKLILFQYRDDVQIDCVEYSLIDTRGAWATKQEHFPKCPDGAPHTCRYDDCLRDTRYVHPSSGGGLTTQDRALAMCEEDFDGSPINMQVRWLLWRLLQSGYFGDVMTEEARVRLRTHYRAQRERSRERAEKYEREREEDRLRRVQRDLEAEERRLRMSMLGDCTSCMFHYWCLEHSEDDRLRHVR